MLASDSNQLSVEDFFKQASELYRNNKDYKNFLNQDVVLLNLDSYPDGYDAKFMIDLFLRNDGIRLWDNAKNYCFIAEWLKKCDYQLLQHPVTGDTIFHENPNIVHIFNLTPAILSLKNFEGIPVEYNCLKHVNFI